MALGDRGIFFRYLALLAALFAVAGLGATAGAGAQDAGQTLRLRDTVFRFSTGQRTVA